MEIWLFTATFFYFTAFIKSKNITILFWIFLTLISMFRYNMGGDYQGYVSLYQEFASDENSWIYIEFGFARCY